MKRKVKVILTAAIFTFCTAIGGCKAVESKLEPVYEALLQEDSVQEEKSVQASENQEMSTKEDLSVKFTVWLCELALSRRSSFSDSNLWIPRRGIII